MWFLGLLFFCTPPLLILIFVIVSIRFISSRLRDLKEVDSRTIKFIALADTDWPKILDDRIAESQSLGFRMMGKCIVTYANDRIGPDDPVYVMVSDPGTVTTIHGTHRPFIIKRPISTFQTIFDDGLVASTFYRFSPDVFLIRTGGTAQIASGAKPPQPMLEKHNSICEGLKQASDRAPMPVTSPEDYVRAMHVFMARYGKSNLTSLVRFLLLGAFVIFAILSIMFYMTLFPASSSPARLSYFVLLFPVVLIPLTGAVYALLQIIRHWKLLFPRKV